MSANKGVIEYSHPNPKKPMIEALKTDIVIKQKMAYLYVKTNKPAKKKFDFVKLLLFVRICLLA